MTAEKIAAGLRNHARSFLIGALFLGIPTGAFAIFVWAFLRSPAFALGSAFCVIAFGIGNDIRKDMDHYNGTD